MKPFSKKTNPQMYSSQTFINNNQLNSPIAQRKQSMVKNNSTYGNGVQANKQHSSKSISIRNQFNKTMQVVPPKDLNPQISVSQLKAELKKRIELSQYKRNMQNNGIQPLLLISKMNKKIDELIQENDNLQQMLKEQRQKLAITTKQSQQLLKFTDMLQSQNKRLQALIILTTHVKQSECKNLKQQLELTKLQKQQSENCMKQMASVLSVLRLLRQKINRQENQNIGLCKFCINKKAIFVNVHCGHLLLCQECVQLEVCKRKCMLCDAEGKYVKVFSSLLRE